MLNLQSLSTIDDTPKNVADRSNITLAILTLVGALARDGPISQSCWEYKPLQ